MLTRQKPFHFKFVFKYAYRIFHKYTYTDTSLMIKNIPSSFEYRFRRDLEEGTRRFQCLIMTSDTAASIHLPKRKGSPTI